MKTPKSPTKFNAFRKIEFEEAASPRSMVKGILEIRRI